MQPQEMFKRARLSSQATKYEIVPDGEAFKKREAMSFVDIC